MVSTGALRRLLSSGGGGGRVCGLCSLRRCPCCRVVDRSRRCGRARTTPSARRRVCLPVGPSVLGHVARRAARLPVVCCVVLICARASLCGPLVASRPPGDFKTATNQRHIPLGPTFVWFELRGAEFQKTGVESQSHKILLPQPSMPSSSPSTS